MNTKLIAGAVGVASMLGLTLVASAAEVAPATEVVAETEAAPAVEVAAATEFNWYGSIRAGAVYSDSDAAGESAVWDLGATGFDGQLGGQGLYSRIGVRGSTDLGGGTSAGFQVEQGLKDTLTGRHHNVWIGGDWGRLTLGQQGNSYRGARNWDQSYFLGGQISTDSGSRVEGIKYSSNRSGPFNFSVMATGSDDAITKPETDTYAVVPYTVALCPDNQCPVTVDEDGNVLTITIDPAVAAIPVADGMFEAAIDFEGINTQGGVVDEMEYTIGEVMKNKDGNEFVTIAHPDPVKIPVESTTVTETSQPGENSVDGWIATASYNAGPVVVNIGHDAKTSDTGWDSTALGVNGSFGAFEWYATYQTASDNTMTGDNIDSFGGFAGFGLSESDKLYLYHVNHDRDVAGVIGSGTKMYGESPTETILGYSHSFGPGASFITEYLSVDTDSGMDGENPKTLVMAVKVDF